MLVSTASLNDQRTELAARCSLFASIWTAIKRVLVLTGWGGGAGGSEHLSLPLLAD